MSATTIEWTQRPGTVGETWNPTTGCNKVDRGCKNCYAEVMHRRLQAMGQEKYKDDFLDGAKYHMDTMAAPYKWQKPRTVFVNSMSDLFHKDVPFEFIDQVFKVIRETPQHTYLVLTKRPEQALLYWKVQASHYKIGTDWTSPPSNLWLGTSANDQASAEKRIPILLDIPNVLRFLSYEPATGAVDLRHLQQRVVNMDDDGQVIKRYGLDALQGVDLAWIMKDQDECWRGIVARDKPRLHWVIMGGESGPKADPMHPAWVIKVRDDCKATGTPFFFKQHGSWKPHTFRKDDQTIYIKFNLGKNEFLFTDPPQNMIRVGKGAAGHEIDGEVWQQFP